MKSLQINLTNFIAQDLRIWWKGYLTMKNFRMYTKSNYKDPNAINQSHHCLQKLYNLITKRKRPLMISMKDLILCTSNKLRIGVVAVRDKVSKEDPNAILEIR